MIVVVSSIRVIPGCEAEIIKAANEFVATTRQEKGCRMYRFLQDPASNCDFCFVEEWQDLEALEAHCHAVHFFTWREKSAHMVAERIVRRYSAQESN